MTRRPCVCAAFALLTALACRVEAKDYEGVKIKGVRKGTVEFLENGKSVKLPVALTLKVYDDKGNAFDPLEGTRFLVPGNVINVKTGADKASGKEAIQEIHFVSGKVADLPKTAEDVDLRPNPDFSGKPIEVYPPSPELERYYRTAKVGEFIEYKTGDQERGRREIVEVGENFVVVAQVSTTFGKPVEIRTKVKLQPQATSKAPAANKKSDPKPAKMGNKKSKKSSKSEPKTATAVEPDEPTEIMVGEHKLVCEVKKDGKSTVWTSQDVPFDGVVKIDRPNYKLELVDFAWKK